MPRVSVDDDNIRHCRCPICPVQSKSDCAKDRFEKYNNHTAASDFKAEEATLLYCSTGKSSCDDLDGGQNCICPTCLVWNENDLQSMYYCLKGNADKNG